MKTTYTNEQLQEAIDVAFHESSGSHLTTMKYSEEGNWNGESRARLDIARAFLDTLPEPQQPVVDGKTPGQVAYEVFQGQDHLGWEQAGYKEDYEAAASAVLAAFGDNLPELTKHRAACDRMSEQEVLSLSQLRPLSKAGPVPEGCVRVQAWKHEGQFRVSTLEDSGNTHFADIQLPSTEKPDPLVTKSDSSPEWTPQAGDVVRLKSGGPLMTVGCPTEHTIPSVSCAWFDGTTLCSTPIPTACLKLSTKEDAR